MKDDTVAVRTRPAKSLRHVVSSETWSKEDLDRLFARAEWMTRQPRAELAKIAPYATAGLLFYQNSTRTMISFQAASGILGAKYVGFSDVKTTRAGDFFQESLEDTVRVLGCYADLLVLRHVDDDAGERAAAHASVPVINAGTGERDHPTQGMLDVWMMTRLLGDVKGRRIGLVGDPRCRAIRATLTVVAQLLPAKLVFLAPDSATLDPTQIALLNRANIAIEHVDSAAELLRHVDLVSMIPFELPDFHLGTAEATRQKGCLADRFVFSRRLIESTGKDVFFLHAGPRGQELSPESDELPNVHYFNGVRAGVFLRAALMDCLWHNSTNFVD